MRVLLVIVSVLVASCAGAKYSTVRAGKFGGRMKIEWVGPDEFIFRPDAQRPFHFTRADGVTITPQAMFTDGGSIPRPLWAVRGYSPWGYGPAFIIHDWLFVAHKWGLPDAAGHTVNSAADVMSEGIKTIMEDDPSLKNEFHLYSMDHAVRSPVAATYWDDSTQPVRPPSEDGFAAPAAPAARTVRPMSAGSAPRKTASAEEIAALPSPRLLSATPGVRTISRTAARWVQSRDFDAGR